MSVQKAVAKKAARKGPPGKRLVPILNRRLRTRTDPNNPNAAAAGEEEIEDGVSFVWVSKGQSAKGRRRAWIEMRARKRALAQAMPSVQLCSACGRLVRATLDACEVCGTALVTIMSLAADGLVELSETRTQASTPRDDSEDASDRQKEVEDGGPKEHPTDSDTGVGAEPSSSSTSSSSPPLSTPPPSPPPLLAPFVVCDPQLMGTPIQARSGVSDTTVATTATMATTTTTTATTMPSPTTLAETGQMTAVKSAAQHSNRRVAQKYKGKERIKPTSDDNNDNHVSRQAVRPAAAAAAAAAARGARKVPAPARQSLTLVRSQPTPSTSRTPARPGLSTSLGNVSIPRSDGAIKSKSPSSSLTSTWSHRHY